MAQRVVEIEMDMPRNCDRCPFLLCDGGSYCSVEFRWFSDEETNEDRMEWCPLRKPSKGIVEIEMDMPKNCKECPFSIKENEVRCCAVWREEFSDKEIDSMDACRTEWCPLKEEIRRNEN